MGRPVKNGDLVIVFRTESEVRAALVDPLRRQRRAWRITSDTSLAEVQLAEPVGPRLVLVTRVYSDSADEFEVIVLGAQGLVRRFSVDSVDWAETAPLARFRLVGGSLYRLGSNANSAFVDRFALGAE